jgi:hypothetical protein
MRLAAASILTKTRTQIISARHTLYRLTYPNWFYVNKRPALYTNVPNIIATHLIIFLCTIKNHR